MFLKKSSANEMALHMQDRLIDNQSKDYTETVALLRSALTDLQSSGLVREAETLSILIDKIKPESDQEVTNLLETGTLFPRKDYADSKDEKIDTDLEISQEELEEVERLLDFEDE